VSIGDIIDDLVRLWCHTCDDHNLQSLQSRQFLLTRPWAHEAKAEAEARKSEAEVKAEATEIEAEASHHEAEATAEATN